MTKQEQHKVNLNNLSCCISSKFEHYSRLIKLGSPSKTCKLKELRLLNIIYKILQCHNPYDCYTYHNYLQNYRFWTPDITDWETGEVAYFSVENQEIFDSNGLGQNTSASGFYSCANTGEANTGYPPTGDDVYWEPVEICENNEISYEGILTTYGFISSEDVVFTIDIEQGALYSCFEILETCCNVNFEPEEIEYTPVGEEVLQITSVTISGATYTALAAAITSATNITELPSIRWNLLGCRSSLTLVFAFPEYPITVDEYFTSTLSYINEFNATGNGYLISHEMGIDSVTLTFTAIDCNAVCYGVQILSPGEEDDLYNNLGSEFTENQCAGYSVNITPASYTCYPACLSEKQVQNLWTYVGKLCGCTFKYNI
jgi:hypothetical protein